ncbi:MAG TPA: MFS transporter [Xanthobacteraceae bacterium]|nr:MFS transporter [Xanthobacteraceae bacterium]
MTPFFVLITTFVYAPYFAAGLAPNPIAGQALWGYATSAAGLGIAVLSPMLGAISDETGPRKPWIAGLGVALVLGTATLWLGRPGDPSMILPMLTAYAIGSVGAQGVSVFVNAIMPTLVPARRLGRLSGTGSSVGYLGGLSSLFFVLGFLAANPQTGRTLLGLTPLFGLDPMLRAGDRAAGPLTALWFLAFAVPLFLFTPDQKRKLGVRAATRKGLATLVQTLSQVRHYRNVCMFLVANMIYADGLVALFSFGVIYAAGTLGWGTVQNGIFGILLLIAGTFGTFAGGRLDDRFGSKPVIIGGLIVLILASMAILSIDRDRIAFVVAVAPPVAGGGLFAAAAERAYVVIGLAIGLVVGPLQASSRTLLARLAPLDRLNQFFGLFALSGRVTSFVAPFVVAEVTRVTASQKAGMAVLILFFIAGMLVLARVRVGRPSQTFDV